MTNYSGIFAVLAVILRPSLIVPNIQVKDISELDWQSLYNNGVRFLVFDKDNCLTKPHKDELEEAIHNSWRQCQQVFGRENILMVSNSSGSSSDPSGLGAESLSRALGVPVLCHAQKKPSTRCAAEALNYFAALSSGDETRAQILRQASIMPPGYLSASTDSDKATKKILSQLKKKFSSQVPQSADGQGSVLLVGDRTMTDVVLAHRMNDDLMRRRRKLSLSSSSSSTIPVPQCVSVLTTQIWVRESMLNTWLRKLEARTTALLIRKGYRPGQPAFYQRQRKGEVISIEWQTLATARKTYTDVLTEHELAPRADQDSTAEYPFTGEAIPTPPLPHPPVGTPTVGSLLLAAISRPLHPTLSRALIAVLQSKPATWTMTNFKTGWNVMIIGLTSGLYQAGLSPLRRTGTLSRAVHEEPVYTQSRAKQSASMSLTEMLDASIPQLDSNATARAKAITGDVQRRLHASSLTTRHYLAKILPGANLVEPSTTSTPKQISHKTPTLSTAQASTQRRALHTSTRAANQPGGPTPSGPPPSSPRPRGKLPAKNWLAALAAVVLVPTCYYAGMRLSDYRAQVQAEKLLNSAQSRPPLPPDESTATRSNRALANRKAELHRDLYHLEHDRKDVTQKLVHLRQRTQNPPSSN